MNGENYAMPPLGTIPRAQFEKGVLVAALGGETRQRQGAETRLVSVRCLLAQIEPELEVCPVCDNVLDPTPDNGKLADHMPDCELAEELRYEENPDGD